jgi:hypothetical protein
MCAWMAAAAPDNWESDPFPDQSVKDFKARNTGVRTVRNKHVKCLEAQVSASKRANR